MDIEKEICISKEYIFIVDTDQFAEPFAGKLAAFCTGFLSEDEPTENEVLAEEFDDDGPSFDALVIEKPNPDGVWKIYSVWPSRTWGMNDNGDYAKLTEVNYQQFSEPAGYSVGIYFDGDGINDVLLQTLKHRATIFFQRFFPDVKVEGFRLISHIKTAKEVKI